jgi:hypothetical protein
MSHILYYYGTKESLIYSFRVLYETVSLWGEATRVSTTRALWLATALKVIV